MRRLLLLMILTILASCSYEQKKHPTDVMLKSIKVSLDDSTRVLIEDIIDTSYIINLKKHKFLQPKYITNLYVSQTHIIIGDRKQDAVFIYSYKGVYINHLQRQANNPERFTQLTDIIFNVETNEIEILDISVGKIFKYDVNGEFIDTLTIVNPNYVGHIFIKSKDTYIFELMNFNPERRRLSFFKNEKNKLTFQRNMLISPKIINGLPLRLINPFSKFRDSIFYLPLLDDKIYLLENNTAIPIYKIDVGEAKDIPNDLKEGHPKKDLLDYWNSMEASNVMFDNYDLFINQKQIYFQFRYKSRSIPRHLFYSKNTGNTLQFVEAKSKTDSSFKFGYGVIGQYNNFFISKRNNSDTDNIDLFFFRIKDF